MTIILKTAIRKSKIVAESLKQTKDKKDTKKQNKNEKGVEETIKIMDEIKYPYW